MSFKEQRELEALPKEIEALEQEQQQLTLRMSSIDYHKQGAGAIKEDRLRADAIERLLIEKFERWSALDQKASAGTG